MRDLGQTLVFALIVCALLLCIVLFASCTPSAQLRQLCESQYDRCAFGQYGQLARFRRGVIEIDEARCNRAWPLCEHGIWHELGHANGHASELEANCYALAHESLPARRAAVETLGTGWEQQCSNKE